MARREREIKKEREESRQERRGNREVRREKREERREQREERRGNREVRRDLVVPKTRVPQGRPRGSLSWSKTSQKLAFHEARVSQLSPICLSGAAMWHRSQAKYCSMEEEHRPHEIKK